MIYYNLNGFNCNVVYSQHEKSKNGYIGIVVKHGDAPESKEIFHFIEHTLISTWYTKYCNYQSISISAKTSLECTQYIISFPKSINRFLLSIELVNSIIRVFFVSRNDHNKVKKDIMFEYNMVLKQAPFQIEQKLLYKIYGLLSAPIGTNESIQKVDKNDVLSGFNKYYTPQNLQIVVLGISEKWEKYLNHIGSSFAHIKLLGHRKNSCPFYSLFDSNRDIKKITELYKRPQYDSYEFTYYNYFQTFNNMAMENLFISLYLLVLEEIVLNKLNVDFDDIIFDIVEVTSNKKVIRISKKKTVPISFEEIGVFLRNITLHKESIQRALATAIQITKSQLKVCSDSSEEQMQVYLEAIAFGYPPYNATDLLKLIDDTAIEIWERAIYKNSKKCFEISI